MSFDLNKILPLVTKPIRYTGGELNSTRPATDRKIHIALCLPDVYEIGMSNYGLRILYSLLNRRPETICERVYTPWPDMAAKLKQAGEPLYSLESRRPLNQFDILGFSLQSELSYTNVLYTLELAGIPLHAAERRAHDPLIVAGGPCCVNPLPMARFFDCLVIGDGEAVLPEIAQICQDWSRVDRDQLLTELARLEGVYVPLRHANGAIRRRVIEELREDDFPFPPLVPTCEIVHDRLTLEIARGCTRGCRFCQAGVLNRPYRFRPVDQILRLAEKGIQASGWEEVSLLSLSALDYPDLLVLIEKLNLALSARRVAISLPSVRGEDFTPELARALRMVKKTGLTFAPETASPKLRALVNKDISEEKTLDSVRTAVDAGWSGIKLYFMIGLPGENEADIREISRLVDEVARVAYRGQVRFNLSPFVPKPHTPLQWAGFEDVEVLENKLNVIRGSIRRRNVKAKWENPEVSCIQAVLARGDERVAAVVERVYQHGGVFQEWTENFSYALWLLAMSEAGVEPADYLRPRDPASPLPWDFVNVGVSPDFLRREQERARAGEFTSDCRLTGCHDCGLSGECASPLAGLQSPAVAVSAPGAETMNTDVEYGRFRRKITQPGLLKLRWRMKYEVGEEFRYASHLDLVRTFYRSLRRSPVPIAYSQGFAPRPLVAFGPPLPVGLTSAAEYLDLEMSGHYAGDLESDLGACLPPGLRIIEARPRLRKTESLGSSLTMARYRIGLPAQSPDQRAAALGVMESVKGALELEFRAPDTADLLLSLAPGIKLFPSLQQLFGTDESTVRCWLTQRLDLYVDKDGQLSSPMEEV